MSEHILKDRLSIDVDQNPDTGWPNGLTKLSQVRIDGRPIALAFFDPRTTTLIQVKKWIALGGLAGVRYVPHSWDSTNGQGTPTISPEAAALKGSNYIGQYEQDGVRRISAVEWDVETKDRVWQQDFLVGNAMRGTKGIRGANGMYPNPADPTTLGYRWGRPGVWTMEGRQDTTTSIADLAAVSGLLVGPQVYDGSMVANQWSWHYELRTWCLNSNPGKAGANIPLASMLPYTDADKRFRLSGDVEAVLFATSRLTELYQ